MNCSPVFVWEKVCVVENWAIDLVRTTVQQIRSPSLLFSRLCPTAISLVAGFCAF
jgi:hypothetical protein